jgi:hypothetical protein
LEAEGTEGEVRESGRPERAGTEFMLRRRSRRADRSGVRASIVAQKPAKAGGAKGRREMET